MKNKLIAYVETENGLSHFETTLELVDEPGDSFIALNLYLDGEFQDHIPTILEYSEEGMSDALYMSKDDFKRGNSFSFAKWYEQAKASLKTVQP